MVNVKHAYNNGRYVRIRLESIRMTVSFNTVEEDAMSDSQLIMLDYIDPNAAHKDKKQQQQKPMCASYLLKPN